MHPLMLDQSFVQTHFIITLQQGRLNFNRILHQIGLRRYKQYKFKEIEAEVCLISSAYCRFIIIRGITRIQLKQKC